MVLAIYVSFSHPSVCAQDIKSDEMNSGGVCDKEAKYRSEEW